ncbi:MAG: cytochrome oxidase subunit III [Saprospiraceae bacterium]|nr:cytochrome c oxidase subunit 3 [Bacteroidia bacterium]NNE13871.1 cytochrome oxidase subunit III [Saprospiraceae bacterium]NNL91703.1 cytochrome oxidase subunit III [Saprospiraceae bacterium]
MNAVTYNPQTYRNKIHPHKFALYVSFASIIMMFGALTSAYIVKSAAGNWLEYTMPSYFYYSTAALILSSICIHTSYVSFKNEKEIPYKLLLIASFILGIAFVTLQYYGWQSLFSIGVDLKGNVSGSFLYLITGLHAAHILGGLACITVAILHAFSLPFIVTEKRKLRFQLVIHYWHFVDILWIYLLIFLLVCK